MDLNTLTEIDFVGIHKELCNDHESDGTLVSLGIEHPKSHWKLPNQIQDCSVSQFVLQSWKTAYHSPVS